MVRAVQSGDSLVLAKTSGKDQFEDTVYLAFITAPKCGNHQRSEEPFAFDAREFVREKLVGRKVDFTVVYIIKDRKYVSVAWEDSTINLMLVKQGLAKALEKKSNDPAFEEIAAASEDCAKRKVGLWQNDPKNVEKHLRQVTYFGEADYNSTKLLEESSKEPKPLAAILEYVFGTNFVSLYVYKLKAVIKMQMVHLYTPKDTEQSIIDEGKQFVSRMLLHRTVGVKLARVDDSGNLVGRIHFPAGDIGCEVLKNGFAKLSTPKDTNFDTEYFGELKKA